jgi:hypothetical protein
MEHPDGDRQADDGDGEDVGDVRPDETPH